MNNQIERPRETVMSLHGRDVASQEYARAEFHQMSIQADHNCTLETSWWLMLNPAHRKRMEMATAWGFIVQSTGLLVLTNYGSVLYGSLGYGPRDQIIFRCGWITVDLCFNVLGMSYLIK